MLKFILFILCPKQKIVYGICVFFCFFLLSSTVLATLLAPLAAYHQVFQHLCVKLEPVLQRLDFSVRGYMMSKPIDNQCKQCILCLALVLCR